MAKRCLRHECVTCHITLKNNKGNKGPVKSALCTWWMMNAVLCEVRVPSRNTLTRIVQ
jgi:hypothetical protein